MPERLVRGDGYAREGHEFRYRLAAGFAGWRSVLDAACGTGYGAKLLDAASYTGVDISLDHLEVASAPCMTFRAADLNAWVPDFQYDVFVSFETIEHLADYRALIAAAKRARQWAILSVPVVPTKHVNPWHLHDFQPGDLQALMADDRWRHFQTVQQPSELSEISVFARTS